MSHQNQIPLKRVHFLESEPSTSKKPCNSHSGENSNMDPEVAKKLFEFGAFVILLDVPPGTEIGIGEIIYLQYV